MNASQKDELVEAHLEAEMASDIEGVHTEAMEPTRRYYARLAWREKVEAALASNPPAWRE